MDIYLILILYKTKFSVRERIQVCSPGFLVLGTGEVPVRGEQISTNYQEAESNGYKEFGVSNPS